MNGSEIICGGSIIMPMAINDELTMRSITRNGMDMLLNAVTKMGLAAIEIAGPLLVAYFLAEIALGLLTKAAPQLQILQFGPPFKILLTLLLVGTAMPLLSGAVESLIDGVVHSGTKVLQSMAIGGGEG